MYILCRFTIGTCIYEKKNHPRCNNANDATIMASAYPAVMGQSMGVNVIAKYSK